MAQITNAGQNFLVILQIDLEDRHVEHADLAVGVEIALVGFLERTTIVGGSRLLRGSGTRQAVLLDDGLLAALGPRLAEAGIPAVIAMQGNVLQRTIATFMPVFFREFAPKRLGQIAPGFNLGKRRCADSGKSKHPNMRHLLPSFLAYFPPITRQFDVQRFLCVFAPLR